ncbi:MAG TPA: peptide-N(4)-(N-acetyl-beta-glucosaminyl)asparagine amidase, partial [Thermoanaerobaculia bacterium]|nr:peptide-N(4)-(N-acetyl-beta-glucosaminyl)asparagine amidase [Thermoanaerobaculia bacterium]
TRNTLAALPNPEIDEDLTTAADGTISGTIETTSEREWQISGFVDTSHGRVETTVEQSVDFTNRQTFLVAANDFVQNIRQTTKIESETKTRGRGTRTTERKLDFPLELDITFHVNPDGSSFQTTIVDQSFTDRDESKGAGRPAESRVSNEMKSKDTLLISPSGAITGSQDGASSQSYLAKGSDGPCFSRTITAAAGLLTSVVDGAGCGGGHGDP